MKFRIIGSESLPGKFRAAAFAAFLFATVLPLSAESANTGTISPREAKAVLSADSSVVLRTREEYESGHIPRAVLLPYDEITGVSAAKAIPDKKTAVIVYCRSGRRSAIAADTLKNLGYRNVRDLGGINAWPYETVK
jgi:rhodanese-related sulfurtransferase